MITFGNSMDPSSLDIIRKTSNGDVLIGYIQWHQGSSPRIVLCSAFEELSLSEAETAISELKRQIKLR